MSFNADEYIKEYNKKNIVSVGLKLSKIYDADILEAIGNKKKQTRIKELIRKALKEEQQCMTFYDVMDGEDWVCTGTSKEIAEKFRDIL